MVEHHWELPPMVMPMLSFWSIDRGEKLGPQKKKFDNDCSEKVEWSHTHPVWSRQEMGLDYSYILHEFRF